MCTCLGSLGAAYKCTGYCSALFEGLLLSGSIFWPEHNCFLSLIKQQKGRCDFFRVVEISYCTVCCGKYNMIILYQERSCCYYSLCRSRKTRSCFTIYFFRSIIILLTLIISKHFSCKLWSGIGCIILSHRPTCDCNYSAFGSDE